MTLLDRFRAQPRHKDPDPAVRLAYVAELPLSERDQILASAREDDDARVRRAAVAKLMDPSALAVVAREDTDEEVRAQGLAMLRDLALEAFEGVTEAEALAAVDALDDQKTLAQIAKTSLRADVGQRALARLTDSRAVASVARQAEVDAVRHAALERVSDRDALLAIALNCDFKDTAVSAVERLSARADLETVANRARNKSAAKRARAIVREADDRAAGEAAAIAARDAVAFATSAAESRTTASQSPAPTAEPIAATPPQALDEAPMPPQAVDQAAARRAEEADLVDAENISAATTAAAPADAGRPSAHAPRALEQPSDHASPVDHPTPSAEIEQPSDHVLPSVEPPTDQASRGIEPAGEHAAGGGEQPGDHGRGAEQLGDHERRDESPVERARDIERRTARLSELVQEMEDAVNDAGLGSARRRVGLVRREWKDVASGMVVDPQLIDRLARAEAQLAGRESQANELEARTRRDALTRLQQLAVRVESLAGRTDVALKSGERALRDLRETLSHVPPLPSRRDYEEIVARLKAAQATLTPTVKELREVADWQRWANIGIQEQLCEKMDALREVADPEEVVRRIRDLQMQWRQASDVPRAQGETLWRRFKAAHDELWARVEALFAAQAAVRADNLAKKIVLCEQAEALADSTSWLQTAAAIKGLQAEWKTVGPVPRGQEKSTWERFRAACDRFFTRRHADLVQRKAVWTENLAKKEALCLKAEAIAESTDWEPAIAGIRRLQAEWKTIGPVKKSRSDAVWQRFRGACDRFYARYTQRHDTDRGERIAAREAICTELERLSAREGESSGDAALPDSKAILAGVRALRARWQREVSTRSIDREHSASLDERFTAAFNAAVKRWPEAFADTELDPDANRKRMEALVKRVEDLAASLTRSDLAADAALSPTDRLASMLKEALAANTIGGKVDIESRYRAAQEELRQAQAGLARIGPIEDAVRRQFVDRFQRAAHRITEAGRPAHVG